jgi:predicted  nucleic acid-binding Zn-ribbon protein
VSQEPVEVELNIPRDHHLLEGVFKVVWEKTRATTDLIRQLRDEKAGLTRRLADLELDVQKLRTTAANQEQELKRIRAEHAELLNAGDDNVLSQDEKERLKSKVRDLIAKINSYL